MRSWVDVDDLGRQFLVRQGRGRVTAVAPAAEGLFLVEVACELPAQWSPALRTTVSARLPQGHPLLPVAREAEASGAPVVWAMEWHRHDDIPGHVPLEHLDLRTNASGILVTLSVESARETDDVAGDAVDVVEEPQVHGSSRDSHG